MGEVYLAQHPRLPRRDALTVLPATLTADSEFRKRFSREADIAAELWHPHIVGIHDRGEFEGQLWLSMDYVDGTDAAELVRSRYPSGMPQADVFEIITAVAGHRHRQPKLRLSGSARYDQRHQWNSRRRRVHSAKSNCAGCAKWRLDHRFQGVRRCSHSKLQNNAGSARTTAGGTSPTRVTTMGFWNTVP
jgi:serine/threonine protein kinase